MNQMNQNYENISKFITNHYDYRTFGNMINHYFCKKNISTRELCEHAGIDRKLVSKFVTDRKYHPSKESCMAVCIGFGLNLEESRDLLKICGYSFANNNSRDLAIVYALNTGIHHVGEINELLSALGEKEFKVA